MGKFTKNVPTDRWKIKEQKLLKCPDLLKIMPSEKVKPFMLFSIIGLKNIATAVSPAQESGGFKPWDFSWNIPWGASLPNSPKSFFVSISKILTMLPHKKLTTEKYYITDTYHKGNIHMQIAHTKL